MTVIWRILDAAFLAALAAGLVFGIWMWLTSGRRASPTTVRILAVAALVAYFVLGWTQGNKLTDVKLKEPVNWPLQLRIIGDYPGVGEGACWEPNAEPGFYGPEDEEVTPEEAAESNAHGRACIAAARRENRLYTKDWANWMSIVFLGTALLAIYYDWRQRRKPARAVPTPVPPQKQEPFD